MGWLKDNIRELRKKEGTKLQDNSTKWIKDQIAKPDGDEVSRIDIKNFDKGGFYFLFYNLQGAYTTDNSMADPDGFSLMKKYSPVLIVDIKRLKNERIAYGINLNFIPERMKVTYFDKLLSLYQNTIQRNKDIKVTRQNFLNINYETAYRTLGSIGYEYIIREYHVNWITQAYRIGLQALDRFMTFKTIEFSRVDDKKLVEIWQKKISEQDIRHQIMMNRIMNNWNEIGSNIDYSVNQIRQSINELNKLKI